MTLPTHPNWRDLVRRLLLHARALGAPPEQAEDLVQEAVATVVGDPARFDPGRGTLLALLKTIVRNRYLNAVRATRARGRLEPGLRLVPPEPPADAALRARDAEDRRRLVLAHLDPSERALFVAWIRQRTEGHRAPRAAASVGLDPAAYEAAKKRLRRRVRAILEDLGLEPHDLYAPDLGARGGSHVG